MSKGEVTGDAAEGIAGARKDDTGKAPIYRGGLSYFPNAIEAVSKVSEFGSRKYAWNGYLHVPDGISRYTDALARHLLSEAKGEVCDADSRLPHSWHTLWNAAARVELMIRADLLKSPIS